MSDELKSLNELKLVIFYELIFYFKNLNTKTLIFLNNQKHQQTIDSYTKTLTENAELILRNKETIDALNKELNETKELFEMKQNQFIRFQSDINHEINNYNHQVD